MSLGRARSACLATIAFLGDFEVCYRRDAVKRFRKRTLELEKEDDSNDCRTVDLGIDCVVGMQKIRIEM
jgi:hypothetical protein